MNHKMLMAGRVLESAVFSTSCFTSMTGSSVLIDTAGELVPNSGAGSLGRKVRPLLAVLPRQFQIGHEENRIREDMNASRISTKTMERRFFMDFIRKLVSKRFCVLCVILGKKLGTIGRDNGVLNEEKMTFPTLYTSDDFGKKVGNVFI
ncbi:hypothetical protein Tco_1037582 [Tanacetum coccineum]